MPTFNELVCKLAFEKRCPDWTAIVDTVAKAYYTEHEDVGTTAFIHLDRSMDSKRAREFGALAAVVKGV